MSEISSRTTIRPYDGDESFLAGPTEATNKLWGKLQELQKEERKKGGVFSTWRPRLCLLLPHMVLAISVKDLKGLEKVVGLQTDKPLKRALCRMVVSRWQSSPAMYGYQPSEKLHEIFTQYHKTHNDAVFDIYTPEMKRARHSHILTGLPDTYGRGRIVGDYRRVSLYGIDFSLIESKKKILQNRASRNEKKRFPDP